MTTETPPDDWVLIEAAELSGTGYHHADQLRFLYKRNKIYHALCDLIAKHEKPPLDRKLLCAREALREASLAHADVMWTDEDIAVRAIELWEECFGYDPAAIPLG